MNHSGCNEEQGNLLAGSCGLQVRNDSGLGQGGEWQGRWERAGWECISKEEPLEFTGELHVGAEEKK